MLCIATLLLPVKLQVLATVESIAHVPRYVVMDEVLNSCSLVP